MEVLVEGEEFAQGSLGLGAVDGDMIAGVFCGRNTGNRKQGRGGKVGDAADDLERAAGAGAGGGGTERFDFSWRAFADDAALVDDDDAVGESIGLFEVVGGKKDSLAAGGEGADLSPHAAAGFDVQTDGWFVKEDEIGITGEGEGEEHTLLLAAGELAEHAGLDAIETSGASDVGVGQGIGIVTAEDADVLANAEHLGSPADLQHNASPEARCGVARVGVKDANGAAGGNAEAHHELDGSGFSGAIGTQ